MLKRKIRKLAITGITIVTAALLTTLIAGTASAATNATPAANSADNLTFLCVHGANNFDVCARGRGSQAIEMTQQANGVSAWFYPTYGSGYGEIQEYGTDLCMQLDHAAGNIVIEATCSGPSFQLWEVLITGQIRSDWDTSLCLQYDNAAGNVLVAGTCVNTWYEIFFPR